MNNNNTELQDLTHEKNMLNPKTNQIANQNTVANEIAAGQDIDLKSDTEMNCYESILNCFGCVAGCLRTWLPVPFCCCPYPYIQVDYSNIGIVERFGKYQRQVDAGLYYINPSTESLKTISTKTQIILLQPQMILTQDNITVKIETVVYFRIVDVIRCNYRLKDPVLATKEISTAALRAIAGEHTLQDLLEEREKINDKIEEFVDKELTRWGIYVEQVFIKDMVIDKDLQVNLSAASKAKRLGESKVISAKSDVEAAKLLRQAADILDSDAAMQIRYFEAVQTLSDQQCPKILFLPMHNEEFDKKKSNAKK